jgi:hypothetical protein
VTLLRNKEKLDQQQRVLSNKFDIYKDYASLVYEAIHQSFQNTNYFISLHTTQI